MADAEPGDNGIEFIVGKIERLRVAFGEVCGGRPLSGNPDHRRREIDANRAAAPFDQLLRDIALTAAQIEHSLAFPDLGCFEQGGDGLVRRLREKGDIAPGAPGISPTFAFRNFKVCEIVH